MSVGVLGPAGLSDRAINVIDGQLHLSSADNLM